MFALLTDSGCDLTAAQLRALDIQAAPLTVTYDENTTFPDGSMDPADFYAGIRAGKMPQTAAVNPQGWAALMEPALRQGRDVLAIPMAAGISATYQSAVIAAEELGERYPDREICVVDSTTASLTLGLLVRKAAQLRDRGCSARATAQWVEEHKKNYCVWLMAEDLMHLKRGGRLGAASAVVGTMLHIKPLIHLNDEGKLEAGPKIRGRKAAIQTLTDLVRKNGIPEANAVMAVGHTGCIADAEALAQVLRETCGPEEVIVGYIGTVIGAHVGPDALTVCYVGAER